MELCPKKRKLLKTLNFCVLTDGTKWSKNRLVQSNSFRKEGDVVDAHKLQQSSAKSFGLPNKQERV